MIQPTTVDFETHPIEPRPAYPPRPVGVAIKAWGKKSVYYSFAHRTKNNCTEAQARKALAEAWKNPDGILCQNAKFDLDVAETFFNMPRLHWSKIHDTMLLLFLDDPHQKQLGLKPSAERLLGLPPEEQDIVGEWLIKNQPVDGVKISKSPQSDNYFMRFIAEAPGDLVGKYAIGDVDRTAALFKLLYPKTLDRQMGVAYDRERQLLPGLLDVERQGVPVDKKRLSKDVSNYQAQHARLSMWLLKRLKAPQDLNLDSGQQLVDALVRAGLADTSKMALTDTGKVKSDKENLLTGVTDPVLMSVLTYRTQLGTCLRTFMEPWLATAEASGGRIFTTWNQVKGDVGARTGRLSSTPNFQNIPKVFAPLFRHEATKNQGHALPKCPLADLPPLPRVRSYVTPWASDHVLLDRDYSQQELRVLAHFEDGNLAEAYRQDPWMDVHEHARLMINRMTGRNFERKPIKNTGFGLLYGMGIGKLAIKNGLSYELSKEIKEAYLATFPGLKQINYDMKQRAAAQKPIRTWGGREYFCEQPIMVDGQVRTFEYKLINYLIQGSSADCTKEALIRFIPHLSKDVKLLINVHDEVLITAKRSVAKEAMRTLSEKMESVEFDVPMLSEGKWSKINWSDLQTYDEKGVVKCRL